MLEYIGKVWDDHLSIHLDEREFVLLKGGCPAMSAAEVKHLPWASLGASQKHQVVRGMQVFCMIAQDFASAFINDHNARVLAESAAESDRIMDRMLTRGAGEVRSVQRIVDPAARVRKARK